MKDAGKAAATNVDRRDHCHMGIAAPPASPTVPELGTPKHTASRRFDGLVAILSAFFGAGLYLDGWAHVHGHVDQSFFTPWHAALYSGFLVVAAVLGGTALLFGCIQALPEKHQQIIYLRFYVDNSLEGIAAALGCSVGTVKSRLFRALDKLRTMNALRFANVERRVGIL